MDPHYLVIVRNSDNKSSYHDFPKSREGLAAAYKFAKGYYKWSIYFEDELVDLLDNL
jgi:hypothetical protein